MESNPTHRHPCIVAYWELTVARWKDLKRLARWLNRTSRAPIAKVGSLPKEDLAAEIWLLIN